jgi:hypothetical protein
MRQLVECVLAATVLCAAAQLSGCTTPPAAGIAPTAVAPGPTAMPAKPARVAPVQTASVHGILVESLHLSSAGSMLDFRYRVIDPVQAAPLLDGRSKVYLLDEAHGATLGVPESQVLGRIRQTSRNNNISTEHTYFIMFGNPGKAVRSGDTVTLLLGDERVTDVRVQ